MNLRLLLAAGVIATPILIAGACTFPDIGYATDDAGSSSGTPDGPPAPADATSDSGDGAIPERPDGAQLVDASCGLCDCDGDGYLKPGCIPDASEDVNGKKDGDCNDSDPIVHPDSPGSEFVPVPPNRGDWNCDGIVSKKYDGGVKCALPVALCSGNENFLGETPCGTSASLYRCGVVDVVNCAPVASGSTVAQFCQ